MRAYWLAVFFLAWHPAFGDEYAKPADHSGGSESQKFRTKVTPQKNLNDFYESGKNGNPSFDVEVPVVDSAQGAKGRCGATRVAAPLTAGCFISISAHCIEDFDNQSIDVKVGVKGGGTKSFKAQVKLHETYAAAHARLKGTEKKSETISENGVKGTKIEVQGEKPFDVAVLKANATDCEEAGLQAVPICSDKPADGEEIFLGSSWQGKMLHGKVTNFKDGSAPQGDWYKVDIDESSNGISQGDSGSGSFRIKETPEQKQARVRKSVREGKDIPPPYCQSGILSSTGTKKPGMEWTPNEQYPAGKKFHLDTSYAGMKSMEWVEKLVKSFAPTPGPSDGGNNGRSGSPSLVGSTFKPNLNPVSARTGPDFTALAAGLPVAVQQPIRMRDFLSRKK